MQNANFWFIDRTSSLSFFVVRQAKRPRHTNDNARWFTAVGQELYPFLPFPNLWRTSLLQSMFPWCTILLSPWSVKSCSFLISVWHSEAHRQYIRFSQNVRRKSDFFHKKTMGKIKSLQCQGDTKLLVNKCIITTTELWDTCQFVFHHVSAISF